MKYVNEGEMRKMAKEATKSRLQLVFSFSLILGFIFFLMTLLLCDKKLASKVPKITLQPMT